MNQEELQFAYKKPLSYPYSIDSVIEIETEGQLKLSFAMTYDSLLLFTSTHDSLVKFLRYDEDELRLLQRDIKGLRSYPVRDLQEGSKGGMKFHRIRKELIFSLDGVFNIKCEDVYGNKRDFRLDSHAGIYIPPFVLHTYKTIEDGELLVIANTLFNPSDLRTQDSYSQKMFRKLQEQYR